MTRIELRTVGGAASPERAAFYALPTRVYDRDPSWAPASVAVAQECFADADAGLVAMHPVVALCEGTPVAGAAAILHPEAVERGGPQGWIGLIECLPGQQEAGVAVVDECRRWLVRRGAVGIVAPRSTALVAGLLVAGFEHPQAYLTAHNPPWYAGLLASAGFHPTVSMVAFEWTRDRAPRFHLGPLGAVRVRHVDPARLHADVDLIHRFQQEVFAGSPGHVTRMPGQTRALAERLLPDLDPELVLLAEDAAGGTIGVLICAPDDWQRRPVGVAPDRARLISIGVAHSWRGRGIAMAMGSVLADTLIDKGYRTLEASWVVAPNRHPQLLAHALGARATRRFELDRWAGASTPA